MQPSTTSSSPSIPSFMWNVTCHVLTSPFTGGLLYLGNKYLSDVPVTSPVPYIVYEIARPVIGECISFGLDVTHYVALKILGDRAKYEENSNLNTVGDRLRTYSWKVINQSEGIVYRVDGVFSNILKIRSLKEIKEDKILDRQLTKGEIIRKIFLKQVKDAFIGVSGVHLGLKFVRAIGFTIEGQGALIGLFAINFLVGLKLNFDEFQNKVALEKKAERERVRAEANSEINSSDGAVANT